MVNFKFILNLFLFLFILTTINAEIFNEQGDFTITTNSLENNVYNDNIQTNYIINIKNNKYYKQNFDITLEEISGWDIEINPDSFSLNSEEETEINLKFKANSEFNYATNVRSPDTIKISQKDNYIGAFEFPIKIVGEEEEISLNLELDVQAKEKENEIYYVEFSNKAVSPENPLNFAIKGNNIFEEQIVKINLVFAGENFDFTDLFSEKKNYYIYEQNIPSSVNPGIYDAKVTIRLEKGENGVAWEWNAIKQIEVKEFSKINEKISEDKNLFTDKTIIKITNLGNKDEEYSNIIQSNILKNIFLHSNSDYENTQKGLEFKTELKKGETKTIEYTFNYIPLYILIIIIISISSYIFVRKNSNPLDLEINLYEIKKIKYEGVKQLKVKIGFENIKEEEIDNLSIIFRMPKYLNIKDNSFLLSKPNNVLKGANQYKLSWNFKRFEKDESRIVGFTLVNARGILGDIKIPDVEIEIKNKGKIKKYYKSVPLIKG